MGVANRTRSSPVPAKKSSTTVTTSKTSKSGEATAAPQTKKLGREGAIQSTTLKNPITLLLLFFCFALVKDLLEDREDVGAKGDGHVPESLKPWLDLAITIGSMVTFTALSTRFPKKALFYSCVIFYLGFFGVSGGQIVWKMQFESEPDWFPRWAAFQIHLQELVVRLTGRPHSSLLLWTNHRHVLVEAWGSVVVPVFFWGLANKISTAEQAKWMYPSFGLIAYVAHKVSGHEREYFYQVLQSTQSCELFRMLEGFLLCLLICGLYWLVNAYPGSHHVHEKGGGKQKKQVAPLGKHYTNNFATFVVANGIIYSLVEETWRSKLKEELANPLDLPMLSQSTGVEAKIAATLLSTYVFQNYGWGLAAAITPTLLLGWLLTAPRLGGHSAASYLGAFGYIWCTNAYYSFAYPCKQMAYMPMDEHAQAKFKATFDLVVGRHAGVLVQQLLMWKFGSLSGSTPYVEAILVVAALSLLYAAIRLSKEMILPIPRNVKTKSE